MQFPCQWKTLLTNESSIWMLELPNLWTDKKAIVFLILITYFDCFLVGCCIALFVDLLGHIHPYLNSAESGLLLYGGSQCAPCKMLNKVHTVLQKPYTKSCKLWQKTLHLQASAILLTALCSFSRHWTSTCYSSNVDVNCSMFACCWGGFPFKLNVIKVTELNINLFSCHSSSKKIRQLVSQVI